MSIFSNRFSDAREEAGDYTAALLGLLGDRDPYEVLAAAPDEVARLTAGLTPEEAARPEARDKWSIVQVVRHLADSELIWGYRVRRILADNRPAIEGYDQDRWAEQLRYDRADLAGSLAELRALRAGHLRLIRSLTPEQMQRYGVHTERGQESVEHLVRIYAGHDLLHQRQIARIRAAVASG